MPITDIGSYVPTGQEFDAHWIDVNAFRVANASQAYVLPDGYGQPELAADVAGVEAAITAEESFNNAVSIAIKGRDDQKDALHERMVDFRKLVDFRLKGSVYASALQPTPQAKASQQKTLRALDDMADLWTRINADAATPNFTPPLVYPDGFAIAGFQTNLAALRVQYKAVVDAENDARIARKQRDALLDPLRDRFVSYREGIAVEYGEQHAFTLSLPGVYPHPGSTPDAVVLSGYWDAGMMQAVLSWTASGDQNLQVYELRGCIGATYDEATSEFLANYQPGVLGTPTLFGLVNSGDTVTFKVFVHLTTGNQAGSNPVTITRT